MKYDDIINLERPLSNHPKMPPSERAGEFLPFSALNGFAETIEEESVETERKIMLSDSSLDELNYLLSALKAGDCVSAEYFLPIKNGEGKYVTISGKVTKKEESERIIMISGKKIPFDSILRIKKEGKEL